MGKPQTRPSMSKRISARVQPLQLLHLVSTSSTFDCSHMAAFLFRGFSNEWPEFIIRHFHWILLTQYSREKKGGRKSKITKFFSTDVARLVVYFQLFFPFRNTFSLFQQSNCDFVSNIFLNSFLHLFRFSYPQTFYGKSLLAECRTGTSSGTSLPGT